MTILPEPDPRSRDFLWRDLPDQDLRCVTAEQIAQFNTLGGFVFRNAIGVAGLSQLLAEIDPVIEAMDESILTIDGGDRFAYGRDNMVFACNLVERLESVRMLVTGPLFRALVHDLIGPDVRLYWDQAVYKGAGRGAVFPWHQDNGYTFSEPQAYLTCWLALEDATTENGCPEILPGLHRRGTLIHDATPEGLALRGSDHPEIASTAIALEARAGDIVVFSSLTPHRTGANRTDRVRKALILQFMPDGMQLIERNGAIKPLKDPVRNPLILCHGSAP